MPIACLVIKATGSGGRSISIGGSVSVRTAQAEIESAAVIATAAAIVASTVAAATCVCPSAATETS
jgi:hypothetical protein